MEERQTFKDDTPPPSPLYYKARMKVSEFDYQLPPELIAQEPARPRDSSRLLVVHRESGRIEHRAFRDLLEYLRPDDVVVLNETRVIRARLVALRPGGGKAEVLLLEERESGVWEALVSPGRRLPPGREVLFPGMTLRADILERTDSGGRLLRFHGPAEVIGSLATLGEVPLPPYITKPLQAESDYQTVYAAGRPGRARRRRRGYISRRSYWS